MKEKKRHVINIVALFVVIVLALLLFLVFAVEKTTVTDEDGNTVSKIIKRDGMLYYPRQDIVNVLLIGIDNTGEVQDSGSYNNSGQADFYALVTFDRKAKTVSALHINRDTMTDVSVLALNGKVAGTRYEQIALAHNYGSGLEDSCKNCVRTVSDFLSGTVIDYYISLNMDAVALLNDAVGGVTVNVTDDFSDVDDEIRLGECTLFGEHALTYIRARSNVADETNLSRMERQREYINAICKKLINEGITESKAKSIYERITPYCVTDCLINLALEFLTPAADEGYTFGGIETIPGEAKLGDEFMEFYADSEALTEIVTERYYSRLFRD